MLLLDITIYVSEMLDTAQYVPDNVDLYVLG
jgi:hypothetical protein